MKDSQGIELFEEEIQKLISYRIHLRKIISLMKKKKVLILNRKLHPIC